MNYKIVQDIISPSKLKEKYPIKENIAYKIENHRNTIKNIIRWKDKRKLLIIGPCSIDFENPVMEYAEFLKSISEEVNDKIFIVMRFYTSKPRTIVWWKWTIQSMPCDEEVDISWQLEYIRKLALSISDIWLPLADEMLYPEFMNYFEDFLSYIAIWARSSENQHHREVASWLDIPVWVKNNTCGSMKSLLNSILAVQYPHNYIFNNQQLESKWNSFAHWVLRWWESWSNYSFDNIKSYKDNTPKEIIKNWLIVDLNHWNSWKQADKQVDIMEDIIKNIIPHFDKDTIKWFMVESYLQDWNQKCSDTIEKWQSFTDPCIWKEKTKKLIYKLYEKL